VPGPTLDGLSGVFVVDANDIWAAGANGAIAHYDGRAWSTSTSGTALGLDAVWASGPHDVWIAGDDGAILHRR
jgi:hypothetical protein